MGDVLRRLSSRPLLPAAMSDDIAAMPTELAAMSEDIAAMPTELAAMPDELAAMSEAKCRCLTSPAPAGRSLG